VKILEQLIQLVKQLGYDFGFLVFVSFKKIEKENECKEIT